MLSMSEALGIPCVDIVVTLRLNPWFLLKVISPTLVNQLINLPVFQDVELAECSFLAMPNIHTIVQFGLYSSNSIPRSTVHLSWGKSSKWKLAQWVVNINWWARHTAPVVTWHFMRHALLVPLR